MSFTLASLASLRVLIGVAGFGYSLYSRGWANESSPENTNFNHGKFLEAIYGGSIGNLIYDFIKDGTADARELINKINLQGGVDELNHDLQRAARKAQLMATWVACQSCLENLKFNQTSYLKRLKNLVVNDEDRRWLIAVSKRLKEEIDALPNADFDDNLNYAELFQIFDKDNIVNPETSAKEFADKIKKENLKEIRENYYSKFFGQIAISSESGYEMLKDAVLNGWDELSVEEDSAGFIKLNISNLQPNENGKKYDWFMLVCILFNEEFKNNEKIQAAINKREILEIKSLLLASDSLGYLGKLDSKIDDLIKEISDFREENYSLHKNTHRRLDEIKDILEADKNLSPEERQAKEKELIDKYLEKQIKDYPIADVVGEIYSADKFFVDREEEKQNLPNWLMNDDKIVVIKGISGNGKTALMTEVLRAIVPDENKFAHDKVKGILTFYFRDFSGNVLNVNLLDICRKTDARLAKDNIFHGYARQYEEFRKVNSLDIPQQIIAHLCQALNSLGDIWFVFDNFESALQSGEIKDKEIEALMVYALRTQPHLRFLITSQVLPIIPNVQNIRQCVVSDLPADFAKKFLWAKGRELKDDDVDCGLAEATTKQFDQLFTKLLPTPISLVSFVAYLETICDKNGKGFEDVLADDSLFVNYQDFDADDKNKGARKLIRRQFELLSEVEQLILKALSVFPKAIEFPVLQSILPLSLEEETLRRILKSNSLVRKVGRNLFELLPLPKEVIAKQFEQTDEASHKFFNLKAATFYRSVHKEVDKCYTLEHFDSYFKEIEHYFQAGLYERIVYVINEIMPKTTPLGMMNETLTRSRRIESLLTNSEAKANNHVNIGLSLNSLGKLNEAIIEYDKAIEIRKDLVDSGRSELSNDLAAAYLNKGVSLDSLGKLNEAIIEYDKAIEIRKDLVDSGRSELSNDLAGAYMNKGNVLNQNGDAKQAVEMFSDAINLWENELQQGYPQNLPNLVKALWIRVQSLIKLEDWVEIAADAVKSLGLTMTFLQDENFSDHFKQQIGGEFGGMLFQIKQLSKETQEKIFAEANKLGETEGEKIPFGDILRKFINGSE